MDYKSIENFIEQMNSEEGLELFLDYLCESADNKGFSILYNYAGEFREFKDLICPLRHLLGVTVLENIAKEGHSGADDMLKRFKVKYGPEIVEEANSFKSLSEYLFNKGSRDLSKHEKIILVNFDAPELSNEEVVERIREIAFPVELRDSREFVRKYRETLVDMIYLSYRVGHRGNLIKENYFIAEWILKNRKYDFITGPYLDVGTLAHRMWQIIDEKCKQGLFD